MPEDENETLSPEPTREERLIQLAAYVLMGIFVIATPVGVGIVYGVGWGVAALGVASGAYGLLLGME